MTKMTYFVIILLALAGLVTAKVELIYLRSDFSCTDASEFFDAIGESFLD